ncbi:MAG: hypothetical protein AAGE52_37895 [Myxococcota bacterium]
MRGGALKALPILAAALAIVGLRTDQAQAVTVMVFPPAGFNGYASFIANGEYDPASSNPDVPGCFQGLCDGDFFQTEIMGRTLDEVDEMEVEAAAFFVERFGVDPTDPANLGKIFFRRFFRDPRIDLRANVLAGTLVPRRGFPVRDGGCSITFLEDFPLGGEMVGTTAPAGSSIVWGEYNIDLSYRRRHRRYNREVVIGYRSMTLTEQAPTSGILTFQNELVWGRADPGAAWGSGVVQALFVPETLGEAPDTIRANERHTLTFSSLGGL